MDDEYSDSHLPVADLPSGVLVARQNFAPDLKCSPRMAATPLIFVVDCVGNRTTVRGGSIR
jgi:hypothetical protein